MSMANYLQRSLFKWKYTILIILIISATLAAVSFQINRWLPHYALSFSNLMNQQLHTKISFRTVHYRLPNDIIFEDVNVLDLDDNVPMLQASKVIMNFSFPLFSSATPLHDISINDMVVHFPVFKNYWTRHNKEITVWAKTLPKENMRLLVPNGRCYLKDPSQTNPIDFTIALHLNQGHVNAQGSWGNWSSINLWGGWRDNNIDWKGFIFYGKHYILDIDGHLKIREDDIILKRLSFWVDGNNVTVRGRCSKQNLLQCDADMALKNTQLHLHSQNTAQGLVFKGWADYDRVHGDFENLKILIINDNSLKLEIKQMQSIFSIQGHQYKIPLENLLASFNDDDPTQKTISLSARMFGGHGYSRIFLNTASLPWQIKSQGSFEGIKINFDNTDLQAWAAKTLQMPSLNHVSGADFSCRYKIDGKAIILDDLKLNADDFDLKGFFHLDADDLVSSRCWVRFSKQLLNESVIGREIMGLVPGAWTLPFEFQLSGNMYRMNFQWDKSPLKDKVRQHIFSFFAKVIDRRMNAQSDYKVTIPNVSVSPG